MTDGFRPDNDVFLQELCFKAGRRARLSGIEREFNPFNWILIREEIVSVPAEIWAGRSDAWLAGWDDGDSDRPAVPDAPNPR